MAVVLISIALIIVNLLICDLLRQQVTQWQSSLIQKLILDAILTLELIGPSFEFGVIFNHYGIATWTVGLFLNVVYQLNRWKGLTPPTPYAHLLAFFEGKETLFELILRNFNNLAVGLLTYRLMTTNLWNYELSPLHVGRAYETSYGICTYPWPETTLIHGILSEFIGTLVLVRIFSNDS